MSEPIKPTIAIVAPYFPPRGGGLERYAYEIGTHILNTYRVIVVTTGEKNCVDTVTEENGMTVYRLGYTCKISNTPLSLKWFFSIRTILKKEKPQLVNIHMPVPGIGDVVALIAGKTPIVVTYHTGSMRKNRSKLNCLVTFYESLCLPLVLRKAVYIVCSSDFIRFGFLKKYQYKSITISPAVDSHLFKPDTTQKTLFPSILFVAGLDYSEQYKGLSNLIDSIVEVKKIIPNVQLTVVGDGDMKEEYIKKVEAVGLKKSVVFTGRLSGDDLAKQYQKSHIFVQPSVNESFGMVTLEALSSGVPVIGVNIGGTKEVIDDGKNGFLIQSNDPRLITEKILLLLGDDTLVTDFGLHGRKKVEQGFSWDTRADTYTKIFTEILEKYQSGSGLLHARKIAIIGVSASGKTTLAKLLAEKTDVPVFYIDHLIWKNNEEKFSENEYFINHDDLINKNSWIIEGYVDKKVKKRLEIAEKIIYLDYPGYMCSIMFLNRWIGNKGLIGANLPEETFLGALLKVFFEPFLNIEKKQIKYVLNSIDKNKVIRITSPKKLEEFLSVEFGMSQQKEVFSMENDGMLAM